MGTVTEPAIAILVPYHKGSWDRMGAESLAGPGWKSWSARLDRSLGFLLPRE